MVMTQVKPAAIFKSPATIHTPSTNMQGNKYIKASTKPSRDASENIDDKRLVAHFDLLESECR